MSEDINLKTWTVPAFASEILHEHTNTVYRRIKCGQIKAVKIGNRKLIPDTERVRIMEEGLPSIPKELVAA